MALLALVGVIISSVWIVAGILGVGPDGIGSSSRGNVAVKDLRPGDCIATYGVAEGQKVGALPTVPCADPHQAEVYAVFWLTGSDWPGREVVSEQAAQGCLERLASYAPHAEHDVSLSLILLKPTPTSWSSSGDRGVTCLAVTVSGTRIGSIRG